MIITYSTDSQNSNEDISKKREMLSLYLDSLPDLAAVNEQIASATLSSVGLSSSDFSRVPVKGGTPHTFVDTLAYKDNLERRRARCIRSLKEKRRMVLKQIASVPSDQQRKALIEKYINGASVDQIAKKWGVSRQYVYKILKQGVKAVEMPYNNNGTADHRPG